MNWRMLLFVCGVSGLIAMHAPNNEPFWQIVLKCLFIVVVGNAMRIGREK